MNNWGIRKRYESKIKEKKWDRPKSWQAWLTRWEGQWRLRGSWRSLFQKSEEIGRISRRRRFRWGTPPCLADARCYHCREVLTARPPFKHSHYNQNQFLWIFYAARSLCALSSSLWSPTLNWTAFMALFTERERDKRFREFGSVGFDRDWKWNSVCKTVFSFFFF